MRRTTLAAVCIAVTTAVFFTGCADSDDDGPFAGQSGDEIIDTAFAATTAAPSVRVKGDMQDETAGGMLRIDLAMDQKGDCVGTIGADGGKTDLIKVGKNVYMRYDEAFLRAQMKGEPKADVEAAVDMLAGKWTMSGEESDASDIADLCSLDQLLGEETEGTSDATRGKTTTIDGTPALALVEKDGKDTTTMYVATKGKPYVLRLTAEHAEDPGTLTFSDYGKPVGAKKPAGEILDLDDLG
ncbi:hypothetical protein [Streptomyces sp. enrichment culture]|uniref:hypothetical protein n=1 Tax=Streptomyces sp. enrichment culture TaxID=1795815 RepID=UPI003F5739D4